MRQSHLILSNALIMWISRVFLLFPQLILVPYLIKTIGEDGYGVYALVWSLLMSLDQLERSLQSGVVKYSAGFLALGSMDEVNKVVSSSFLYSVFLAIIACAGMLVAARLYSDPTGRIGSALIVVAVMILFIFPLTPYISVIKSKQRFYVSALAETISKYFSLGIIFAWFAFVTPTVEALIIITTLMLFLSRLIQVPVAYMMVPGLRNRLSLFDGKNFKLIAAFGSTTVFMSMCLGANLTGTRWLMDYLVSTEFVAHLAIMLMPTLLLSQIINPITITAMPATSAYEATGNIKMLYELLLRGMRYTAIIVIAGLLAAALFMRGFLNVWVGPDYLFLAPYAVALFAGGSFMQSTSIAHHMLKGMGRLKTIVFVYLIGLVIVPLSVIIMLVKTGYNPYLAVTAGLVSGNIVCGCLQSWFCAKAVGLELRVILARVYIKPVILASAIALLAFGVMSASGAQQFMWSAGISGLAVLMFFAGCYLFIASDRERREAKDLGLLALHKMLPAKFT